MPFFFPFTNFEKINLDWIMTTLNKLKVAIPMVQDAQTVYQQALDLLSSLPARMSACEGVAQNAVDTADDAVTTATGAVDYASSALSTAQGAVNTAQGAVNTATDASAAATQAGLDATTATAVANSAQSAANTAVSTAAAAQTAAEAAAEDALRTFLKVGYELIASSGPDSTFPSSPGAQLDTNRYVTFLINAYTTYNTGTNTIGSLLIHAGTLPDMLNRSGTFRCYVESSSGTTNAITIEIKWDATTQSFYLSPPAGGVHYQLYGQSM